MRTSIKTILSFAALASAFTAIALLAPVTTQAQENPFYIKGDLGGAFTEKALLLGVLRDGAPPVKFDPGARVGFTAGYQLTDWVAAEAQLGAMVNSMVSEFPGDPFRFANGTLANVPLLINLNLRYPNRSPWVPYVGAGVGGSAAIIDADILDASLPDQFIRAHATGADAVFAYQAFAGLSYELNKQLKIHLEYRYFVTEGPQWDVNLRSYLIENIALSSIKTHTISLAFDYRF